MKVGVLGLQGAFIEHINMLRACGVEPVDVRTNEQLKEIDGLILPGGESTAIGRLMVKFGLDQGIKELAARGVPIYGTCAGMILMAKEIAGHNQPMLSLMDIVVSRNSFGRQVDSFEVDLDIPAFGSKPFRAVFIRAPHILEVKEGVEVLGKFEDRIVCARQGNFLATSFHPELTDDKRVHEYFIKMIEESKKKN